MGCTVRDAVGEPGLLVTRFDRSGGEGNVVRLAVEDGCQVLGVPRGYKYLVDTERMVAPLSGVCTSPAAVRTLLTQLAFAFLTANRDAHAKNLAVVRLPSGLWRPSPAFDLPSLDE